MGFSVTIDCAVVLGGLIGLEREVSNHAAGFRTHILVCIGAALIMLLSIYGFSDFVNEINVRIDPSRLAAQVISGIGFLGAGTILRNGLSISGLTTAASLWVTAGIGLSAGAGFYKGALVATFLVLVCLFLLNKTEKLFSAKHKNLLQITIEDNSTLTGKIISELEAMGIQIKKKYIFRRMNRLGKDLRRYIAASMGWMKLLFRSTHLKS